MRVLVIAFFLAIMGTATANPLLELSFGYTTGTSASLAYAGTAPATAVECATSWLSDSFGTMALTRKDGLDVAYASEPGQAPGERVAVRYQHGWTVDVTYLECTTPAFHAIDLTADVPAGSWHPIIMLPASTAPFTKSAATAFSSSSACVRVVFDPKTAAAATSRAQALGVRDAPFSGVLSAYVNTSGAAHNATGGSYLAGAGPFDLPRSYWEDAPQVAAPRVGPAWCDGPTSGTLDVEARGLLGRGDAFGDWTARLEGCDMDC